MTSGDWRARVRARLSEDIKQLAEVDREIDRLRRLRERIAGKVEARTKDLADYEDASPETTKTPTKARRELKGPALSALKEAGDAGLTEEALRDLLEAPKQSLHTCIWRLLDHEPALVWKDASGVLRITPDGVVMLTVGTT